MKIKATFLIFTLVLCFSCAKKQNAEVDNETQSVLDFSNVTRDFVTLIQATHQAIINTPGTGSNQTKANVGPCEMLIKTGGDTLWETSGHINPTYSIDISTANCGALLPDSKKHEGKLFLRLTDKFQKTGAVTILKSQGFWYSNDGITSLTNPYNMCDSIIIKTLSSDANTASFEIILVNGKVIQNTTGKVCQLSFKLQVSDITSNGSISGTTLYGTSTGINIGGLAFKAEIMQSVPVKKDKTCSYFNSGEVSITPDGFKTRTVNYGSGTCDDNANFTVNENTIAFKLK